MEETNNLAVGIREFIKELMEQNRSFSVKSAERKRTNFEFSVEFNAVRILLIIKYCGNNGKFNSKLKFAFFDFLLRFPICLKYLLEKKGETKEEFSNAELSSIDKKMVKHVSSAWDPDYYNYLSFLVARELINVNFENKFELEITEIGERALGKFDSPEVTKMIRRCKLLKQLYSSKTDSDISEIISNNFSFAVL